MLQEDDEESAEKVNQALEVIANYECHLAEMWASCGRPVQAMWALRGISSRVWILSRQLRNLLCIFLHRPSLKEHHVHLGIKCKKCRTNRSMIAAEGVANPSVA